MGAVAVARGALFGARAFACPSPIEGVADAAWTRLVRALAVQSLSAVSPANGQGMFAQRPRRLCDLGVMVSPRSVRLPSGGAVCVAEYAPAHWNFLRDPTAQYAALRESLVDYARKLEQDEIEPPEEMTLSGALAVLHAAGPGALRRRFRGRFLDGAAPLVREETARLYDLARELF